MKKPYEKYKKWLDKNTESLKGKRVSITGSTGGLGRELSRYLAYLGAELVLVDRNLTRSLALKSELEAEFPATMIRCVTADLSDLSSVKAAAIELNSLGIDYLIHNAGAYSIPRKVCDTGYDNVFQINFLSPYYLTRTVMGGIKEKGGKVVIVGSIAHNYSKTDKGDVDFKTRKKASLVYGNAKRFISYSALKLTENPDAPEISVTHPGISFTGITNHYPKLIFALIKHPMKLIFMKPKKASLSILYGLFANVPIGYWIGPSLFDVWGLPRVKILHTVGSEEKGKIIKTAEKIYQKIK